MRKLTLLLAAFAATAAIAPASASATESTGPCIYVLEDVQCIDPYREAVRVVCGVGAKLGWECLYDTTTRSAATTRQCTQVYGVDGCIESYICGPLYNAGQDVNAVLEKLGVPVALSPFYCTM